MGQRVEEEELERERCLENDLHKLSVRVCMRVCDCVYTVQCMYESVCECEYVCVRLHSNMLYLQAVRVQRAGWPIPTFPGQQTRSETCPTRSSDGKSGRGHT